MKNTIQHTSRGRLSCRIYDNGGRSADRYTACFKMSRTSYGHNYYPYVAFDENPFDPQGFGQYGDNPTPIDGPHLGKRIGFEKLPEKAQKYIMEVI